MKPKHVSRRERRPKTGVFPGEKPVSICSKFQEPFHCSKVAVENGRFYKTTETFSRCGFDSSTYSALSLTTPQSMADKRNLVLLLEKVSCDFAISLGIKYDKTMFYDFLPLIFR